MNPSVQYAAFLGFLGAYMGIISVVGIVLLVLLVIGHWMMFVKAGEAGWKSLIPLYSDYTLFKLVWNTKSFFIYIGAYALSAALSNMPSNFIVGALGFVANTAAFVYSLVVALKTALSYGKGPVFGVGLMFLPSIFAMILGFDSSRYQGPAV